jgi:hypothetical protein
MNTWIKKLALAAASAVLLFLLCEIGMRLSGIRFSGSTYVADPICGWGLRPGAEAWEADEGLAWSKINSHGFRDRERSISKPARELRVAVLGDSLTEARQVPMEKTFAALMEQDLSTCPGLAGRQLQVLNFGVPGYGTAQELLLLRHKVWQFQPDIIVLQFYAGNDMFNNYRALNISTPELAPYFVYQNGHLVPDDSFRKLPTLQPNYIRRKSFAADLMNRSMVALAAYKVMRSSFQKRTTSAPAVRPDGLPSDYARFLPYVPAEHPSMKEAWNVTEDLLRLMHAEVQAKGAEFWIVNTVMPVQIYPELSVRETFRTKYELSTLTYPDDRLESFARAEGIPIVTLSRPLGEYTLKSKTFLLGFPNTAPGYGHLNEAGHRLVSQIVSQALCDRLTSKSTAGTGGAGKVNQLTPIRK